MNKVYFLSLCLMISSVLIHASEVPANVPSADALPAVLASEAPAQNLSGAGLYQEGGMGAPKQSPKDSTTCLSRWTTRVDNAEGVCECLALACCCCFEECCPDKNPCK